jgi:hypothetical protein
MRLIVRIAPTLEISRDDQRPRLLSLYPARVDRPVAVHGRIGVDERGEIMREEKMVPDESGDTRTQYRVMQGIVLMVVVWMAYALNVSKAHLPGTRTGLRHQHSGSA